MKVYLSARFARILEMRRYAEQLRRAGITVTSRWLKESSTAVFNRHDDFSTYAQHDLDDVLTSDILIFFSEDEGVYTNGGRHVEFGIALAQGIPIWVVGEKENVFHSSFKVYHAASWERLLKALGKLEEAYAHE